ncbi:Acetyl-CoA C-myristoyltransferase [Aphelenchoides besseyi]|nr:Acetyl-CoA C-myristoyltransferase [Aphelenchoides besseyi]
MSKSKVFVVGVGMTPFTKPGSTGKDYPELVKDAVTEALDDCHLQYKDIQQAAVGYLYGGTCCGQRSLYELGLIGIPIYNVNNACASGSTAIYMGKQLIEGGGVDVFLAVGFEKMKSGSLDGMAPKIDDRAVSADKHIKVVAEEFGWSKAPAMCQFFGNAGVEHMRKYGTKREHFAKIGYKNHLHSVHNQRSQFRDKYTLDQAGDLIDRGDNTYGGKWVINPSGGLISKGHPIGATGVAQCVELCNQLRGRCDRRQVPNVRVALQHNLGIGGACVITLYKRADGQTSGSHGVRDASHL